LSNPKFIEWSKGFQERIEGQIRAISESEDPVEALKLRTTTLDRGEFYREIVRAAQEFGDFEWFYSRMVKDTEPIQSPGDFQLEARLPNDIAVCIEILIFAVAIAAVFIAVVPGIAVSREEWLSRHDLQKVSGFLAERLTARAQELRQTGALTSLDSVRKGTIL